MNNTLKLIENLPFWFKIKKEYDASNGYKLLNIPGKEFDYMESLIDYAYRQAYIDSADINYPYYLYKIVLPTSLNTSDIKEVKSSNISLTLKDDLVNFLGISDSLSYTVDTRIDDTYYIDKDKNIIYTRKAYDIDANNKNGKLTVVLNNSERYIYKEEYHHVWNQFDEFGYLLSLPRIYKEDNLSYKNRILDVFKNPGNSTKIGLINAIGRELNLRKNIVLNNGALDYIITDRFINLDSLKVDNIYLGKENIYVDDNKNFVIKGDPLKLNKETLISYISGVDILSLSDDTNINFKNELYNIDDSATDKLKYYKSLIYGISPIAWDNFIWDETYWVSRDEERAYLGAIPCIYDSKIDGFDLGAD